MSTHAALRTLIDSASEQVIANWDLVAKSQHPAAIHQLRVGIRRLRTILRQVRAEATRQPIEAMESRLATVSRHIGKTRDIDVLIGTILPAHRGKDIDPGLNRLTAILKTKRTTHAQALAAFFAHTRQKSLRSELSRLDDIANLRDDAAETKALTARAQHDLLRTMKRLKARAAQFKTASIDELHNIRKAAKTVRYTFEFYAALYPPRQRSSFLSALKDLQDVLGALNDLTLAIHIKSIATDHRKDADLRHAAGFIVGYLEAEATQIRSAAHRLWRKVKRTRLAKNKFKLRRS